MLCAALLIYGIKQWKRGQRTSTAKMFIRLMIFGSLEFTISHSPIYTNEYYEGSVRRGHDLPLPNLNKTHGSQWRVEIVKCVFVFFSFF